MYRVDGSSDLSEETLGHFSGYRGSAPVRIGNGAADQLQLDIYGEAMDSIHFAHRHGTGIGHQGWTRLSGILDWLCGWDEPDEGVWETRGSRQDFVDGRINSWTAFDRAVRLARDDGRPGNVTGWTAGRDKIYQQVDGARLARQTRRLRPALRHRRTRRGAAADGAGRLRHPGRPAVAVHAGRYGLRAGLGQPGLPVQSGGRPGRAARLGGHVLACTFWYVDALARSSRLDEAQLIFEKMFTYANHLGLYSEEIGLTGEQLGNFPQAFTHLALIKAALTLNDRLDRSAPGVARLPSAR